MIYSTRVVSALVLFFLFAFAEGRSQGAEWADFKNKVFTLQHPADWIAEGSKQNPNFLRLSCPHLDSSAVLIVELSPGKGRSLEDLRDGVLNEFQGSSLLKTFAVEKNEIGGEGGDAWYELVFSGQMLGKSEKIYIRGMVSMDLAVQMSFTDPVGTWEQLEPIARQVMESFTRK